jgi:Homeodomain-like domain
MTKPHFSSDLKTAAISAVLDHDWPHQRVADTLGCSVRQLQRWIKEAKQERQAASQMHRSRWGEELAPGIPITRWGVPVDFPKVSKVRRKASENVLPFPAPASQRGVDQPVTLSSLRAAQNSNRRRGTGWIGESLASPVHGLAVNSGTVAGTLGVGSVVGNGSGLSSLNATALTSLNANNITGATIADSHPSSIPMALLVKAGSRCFARPSDPAKPLRGPRKPGENGDDTCINSNAPRVSGGVTGAPFFGRSPENRPRPAFPLSSNYSGRPGSEE